MSIEEGLTRLADSYRDQGYEVTVRPGADQLPTFAKDFHIELVGRRGREGVLLTVKKDRDELAADTNVPRYAEVTAEQPGWRFDLAVLEGENLNARDLKSAREFAAEDVRGALAQADELNRLGFAQPALLSAWAALEAAMRLRLRALGQKAGWGSPPREMLRELYSAGLFSPDEFRRVDLAAQLRNQIVHGFATQVAVAGADDSFVRALGEVARRLVAESQPAAPVS